jgi:hypothetical protein
MGAWFEGHFSPKRDGLEDFFAKVQDFHGSLEEMTYIPSTEETITNLTP